MKVISRTARRTAVATAACAAVLAPAAALAAPAHPSASAAQHAAAPKCGVSDLRVWLGVPGDGAAGSVFYQLEMSNISNHTCTLFGFPGVSAVGAGGGQLGSPAVRDAGDTAKTVTLSHGATAHAFLRIVNVGAFPPAQCNPVTAIGLKVFPPNDTGSAIVPFSFQACKTKGPKFLGVRVTVTGTGIPGFSS
jgi:uncharacterized protein DUF4232